MASRRKGTQRVGRQSLFNQSLIGWLLLCLSGSGAFLSWHKRDARHCHFTCFAAKGKQHRAALLLATGTKTKSAGHQIRPVAAASWACQAATAALDSQSSGPNETLGLLSRKITAYGRRVPTVGISCVGSRCELIALRLAVQLQADCKGDEERLRFDDVAPFSGSVQTLPPSVSARPSPLHFT
jgi:hypothetical protein